MCLWSIAQQCRVASSSGCKDLQSDLHQCLHVCCLQALGTEVRTFTGGEVSALTAVLVAAAVLLVCDLLGGMRAVAYTGGYLTLAAAAITALVAASCAARSCRLLQGTDHAVDVVAMKTCAAMACAASFCTHLNQRNLVSCCACAH
jgi:Na+(H+)/acetate symporter ActP